MLDQLAWDGVQLLLDEYAGVQTTDIVVVGFTYDSRESAAWVAVALEGRGISPYLLEMAPLEDSTLESRLEAALAPLAADVRVVILTFELHTMSHTSALRRIVDAYGSSRFVVVRAMSACADLFAHALVSPSTLEALNDRLLNHLTRAQTLRIATPGGTDLAVHLDSKRFRWISNCGRRRDGTFMILPAGEVATYPARINGILVADFAFHVNTITELDVRLDRAPVRVDIRDGRMVAFQCANPEVAAFIDQCLCHQGADAVGELGFGTNFGVQKATLMNSHINERVRGIHLGFGQHNQRGILPSTCEIHLDLIARGGEIWCDANVSPLDLDRLTPDQNQHGRDFQDEDVFSPEISSGDCCGADTVCPTAA